MRMGIAMVLGVFALVGTAFSQIQGTVTGIVLDESGNPVIRAKVMLTEKGVFVAHRLLHFHETDADGHFRVAHVSLGTYIVTVGKEDAGYPNTGFGLYSNNVYPIVVLTEDSPAVDVTLKLGPKAGVLELEPVTDATTGSVIRLAAVRLKRADNPDLFILTSASQRRFLVPPLTRVLIEITAEGYKPWPQPEQAGTEGATFLKPEEVKKLQVALQPEDPAPSSSKR